MGMSSEVSTVFNGSANQAPALPDGKYWADDLTWKSLPDPLDVCEPKITGATGSFTTVDSKTVTVTNGIITSIV